MIELVSKENTMEKKHETTPEIEEMLSNWLTKNGDSLREALQEIDEFLWDSIDSKEWSVDTDPEYVHDVVLFILNGQINKQEKKEENSSD
jgi:glycogen synthase